VLTFHIDPGNSIGTKKGKLPSMAYFTLGNLIFLEGVGWIVVASFV